MDMRTCKKCGEVREGNVKDCRSCARNRMRRHRENNPGLDKRKPRDRREYNAAWRKANEDHVKAYEEANRDKRKDYYADWQKANREKCNARLAEWRKANPEARKAYQAKWREDNINQIRAYKQAGISEISDWYAKEKLGGGDGIQPEMIAFKRAQLKLSRLLKQKAQTKKAKTKK